MNAGLMNCTMRAIAEKTRRAIDSERNLGIFRTTVELVAGEMYA
jgi:hypothetical protein